MTTRPENPEGLDDRVDERGGPAMDYSHRFDREGHPKRLLDDAMTARHMMTRGFTEGDVRHVLGYMPDQMGIPGMSDAPLHPVEDGPGAGVAIEVTVRVMVGRDRSTVVVRRGRDPAVIHEVREHGREVEGIGEAVVREVLARLP